MIFYIQLIHIPYFIFISPMFKPWLRHDFTSPRAGWRSPCRGRPLRSKWPKKKSHQMGKNGKNLWENMMGNMCGIFIFHIFPSSHKSSQDERIYWKIYGYYGKIWKCDEKISTFTAQITGEEICSDPLKCKNHQLAEYITIEYNGSKYIGKWLL